LFASEARFAKPEGVIVARIHSDWQTLPEFDALGGSEDALARDLVSILVPWAGSRGEWRIALCGERFITESSRVRIGPPGLLDTVIGAQPVKSEVASLVPKEAAGAWVFRLEAGRLDAFLAKLLGADGEVPSAATSPASTPAPHFAASLTGDAAL